MYKDKAYELFNSSISFLIFSGYHLLREVC